MSNMKLKTLYIGFTVILLLTAIAAVTAQESLGSQSKIKLDKLVLVGKGLAVDPNDKFNVEFIKAIAVQAIVQGQNESQPVKAGLLFFGDQKFRIKNVEIGNETVNGDLFKNEEKIGNLSVAMQIRNDREIWVGSATINQTDWKIYLISSNRLPKIGEKLEILTDYCSKNPAECIGLIKETCAQQGDDKCEVIFLNYWKDKIYDLRGRNFLRFFANKYCLFNEEKCEMVVNEKPELVRIFPTAVATKLINSQINKQLEAPKSFQPSPVLKQLDPDKLIRADEAIRMKLKYQKYPVLIAKTRGDVNRDGNLSQADALFILDYLFLGGRPPECLEVADVNGDGDVDISDAIYIINHLQGGPAPVGPIISCRNESRTIRGDANGDLFINYKDSQYILSYLFEGGPAPRCMDAADANGDGNIDISDSIFINSYLRGEGIPINWTKSGKFLKDVVCI